jgi:hypothetical protein
MLPAGTEPAHNLDRPGKSGATIGGSRLRAAHRNIAIAAGDALAQPARPASGMPKNPRRGDQRGGRARDRDALSLPSGERRRHDGQLALKYIFDGITL